MGKLARVSRTYQLSQLRQRHNLFAFCRNQHGIYIKELIETTTKTYRLEEDVSKLEHEANNQNLLEPKLDISSVD
jgi:hypothetical protein